MRASTYTNSSSGGGGGGGGGGTAATDGRANPTAVHIAHQLKMAPSQEQVAIAEALLADDRQLFPQKRSHVLQWAVDALIRSQKACRSAGAGAADEPVHSVPHWRLLAQLIPGSDAPVHADLAFAITAAVDGCATDGALTPSQQQLLQHILTALAALTPVRFRPRAEGLRDVLSSMCALATRAVREQQAVPATRPAGALLVLRLTTLAAQMLSAALRQSSNMKRNFALAMDVFSRLISLRAAILSDSQHEEPSRDVSDLLGALDALLSAAMFRPDQLSDYHLAFTTGRKPVEPASTAKNGGARAIASYQSQLFATLRDLVSAENEGTQASACMAVPWVFTCFVRALQTVGEPATEVSDANGAQPGDRGRDATRRTTTARSARGGSAKTLSVKVGFDCFVECHHIVEPLTRSVTHSHSLRGTALRSSRSLLAALDSSGVYRQTVQENAAHSRSAVHLSLKQIWRALMLSSAEAVQSVGDSEPEMWYANSAVAECTTALIKLDHQSVEGELESVWTMLERVHGGGSDTRRSSSGLEAGGQGEVEAMSQSQLQFRRSCTELVRRMFSTYEQLFQIVPLLKSLLHAVRQGLIKSSTIIAFDVCGALRTTAPLLPCTQLPQLFAEFRAELRQHTTEGSSIDGSRSTAATAVDIVVAIFVIVLQYCSVDEASSNQVELELEALNSEVLLQQNNDVANDNDKDNNGASSECNHALAHLRRGVVALEFRLRYEKPVNELQVIRPNSALGTWNANLVPEHTKAGQFDLASTCVALQRIAVLHDSMHSHDAEAGKSRSAQLDECLKYVWRDIDQMVEQHTDADTKPKRVDCAKWEQIAANIFLLAEYTDEVTMEKFFKSVVALVSSPQKTHHVDDDCLSAANNLINDHRFCELQVFREVGLVVVCDRVRDLCCELDGDSFAAIVSTMPRRDGATVEGDLALIEHLEAGGGGAEKQKKKKKTKKPKAKRSHTKISTVSAMAGIATLMNFVRSVPTGFFEVEQVLQCIRMASAVELICTSSTAAAEAEAAAASAAAVGREMCDCCTSAWVEAHRVLGWALAIICTGKMCRSPTVQAALPLINAAAVHFLAKPTGIVQQEEEGSTEQFTDAATTFMETVAADHSRSAEESTSIEKLLPAVFETPSAAAADHWSMFYFTAFLRQANQTTETRLRLSTSASAAAADANANVDESFVTSIRTVSLQVPTCMFACSTALEHLTKGIDVQQHFEHFNANAKASCTALRAMAALLDARRIMAINGSSRDGSVPLGEMLAECVAMATKFLSLDALPLPDDLEESCLELVSATSRVLYLLEPPLPSRVFGSLLAVAFRACTEALVKPAAAQGSRLHVFESVTQGAGEEQMELLLHTITAELTRVSLGVDLPRVWTAIDVLRVTEETIRADRPRHKRALQNHAGHLTRALLRKIDELQHARSICPAPNQVTWHAVTNAATRSLSRLVHYTATGGVREARQTACMLQSTERMSAALSECQWSVILNGTGATLELVAELAKMCARDILQCMPLVISCIRRALGSLWDLSSHSIVDTTADNEKKATRKEWETSAARLCSLYELLPRSLNASALRRYVPYMLSDYIEAALRHGACNTHRRSTRLHFARTDCVCAAVH